MSRARRKTTLTKEESVRILQRLYDLELRMKLLEARVRRSAAEAKAAVEGSQARGRKGASKTEKPRPRCPGCTLELPPGHRGKSCVWCGFRLDAVGGAWKF